LGGLIQFYGVNSPAQQNGMNNNQVKSKQRVNDHGEVFTSSREVNNMLDLVNQEAERVDSRFLEPACGTGNFLVEIINRKLKIVERRYTKNQSEFEFYAIIALSSIYGVDILKDNVHTCRQRLLGIFTHCYISNFKHPKYSLLHSAEFILNRNIIWGNALSLRTPDNKAEPIVFSEWSSFSKGMIKRRDYTMANLLDNQPMEGDNLFSDLGDLAFIPIPVAEHPLTHFLKLGENDTNKL
jgi:hypothetical protein